MEDSPTYLNLESTQDTTELISLKPSHISIGSNEKTKQPIRTQKPTLVPVKPTAFPPLKDSFIQDTHEQMQPREQAPKPPVMNPNTNSPSPADSYSHTQRKTIQSFSLKSAQSFRGQTQTTGLTLMDVENLTASAPVEQHQNQSQIIKQSGGTKSSVTNDTDLVETLKKNTSQAPMRTTDNNNRLVIKLMSSLLSFSVLLKFIAERKISYLLILRILLFLSHCYSGRSIQILI